MMNTLWANAWAHVFESIANDEIEWYAVITYESLVSYHDIVVQELLTVVKSGVDRFRNGLLRVLAMEPDTDQFRRRLPLRHNNTSKHAYLIPSEISDSQWTSCLKATSCRRTIEYLTKEVFPHLGYVSVPKKSYANNNPHTNLSLSTLPGPVTVSRQFGRVLFSSEGDALNALRLSQGHTQKHIEYKPTLELVTKLKYFIS